MPKLNKVVLLYYAGLLSAAPEHVLKKHTHMTERR